MSQVYYTVTATINEPEVNLARYVDWLKGGHVQAVVASGGLYGDVVILESDNGIVNQVESVYVFPTRESLQGYFDGPALELRKEGKELWIDTGIVTFQRRIGAIAHRSG